MFSQIGNHGEYVVAKLAVRKLERAMRDFRKRLLAETDPIAYYTLLTDISLAQARLDDLCTQIGEWKMRGGCLTPNGQP